MAQTTHEPAKACNVTLMSLPSFLCILWLPPAEGMLECVLAHESTAHSRRTLTTEDAYPRKCLAWLVVKIVMW